LIIHVKGLLKYSLSKSQKKRVSSVRLMSTAFLKRHAVSL